MTSLRTALRSRTVKASLITGSLGVAEYLTHGFVEHIGGQYVGLVLVLVAGVFLVLRALTTVALGDK